MAPPIDLDSMASSPQTPLPSYHESSSDPLPSYTLVEPEAAFIRDQATAFEALPDKVNRTPEDVEMQGTRSTATTQAERGAQLRPRGNQRRPNDDLLDIPAAIFGIGWFAVFFLNLNTPAKKQDELCLKSIDWMFLRTGGWVLFYLLAVPVFLRITKRHQPAGVRRSWVAGLAHLGRVVLAFIMVALPVTVITEAAVLYIKYPCPASGESKRPGTL